MARNDQEEYFFDDADIEHLGSGDSEGVVYDHDTKTVESSSGETVSETAVSQEEEYEEASPLWLTFREKAVDFVKQNKRLVYLLVLVLVIYLVARLFGFGIHPPQPASHHTAPTVTTQAAPKPPTPSAKSVSSLEAQNSAVSQEVAGLSAQLSEQANAIQSLTRAVSDLKATTVAAPTGQKEDTAVSSNRLTALQARVDQLTSQLNTLHTQLKKTQQTHKQAMHRATFAPTQSYHVRAIEPGRAWLLADDGSSISVSLSSTVPGYGRVTKINDVAGTVSTESGHTITFSSE